MLYLSLLSLSIYFSLTQQIVQSEKALRLINTNAQKKRKNHRKI